MKSDAPSSEAKCPAEADHYQIRYAIIRVRVGKGAISTRGPLKDRDAWLVKRLVDKGERGVAVFDGIGSRLSPYPCNLRKAGVVIWRREEEHGRSSADLRGRYILRTPIAIFKDATR